MKISQKRLPEATAPDSAEREYLKLLSKYSKAYIELMRKELDAVIPKLKKTAGSEIPRADSIRMDENIAARIGKIFDRINKRLEEMFPNPLLRKWASSMIGDVNRNAKKNTKSQLNAGARKGEETPDFEPLMHDKKLSPYFQNIVDQNVSLIRSIPGLKMEAFKNQLVSMITNDATQAEIRDAIQNNFAVSRDRAALIARDQVGKLNGALNKYRQQQLGGKRYIWRTSKDSKVRRPRAGKRGPDHFHLEGKVFYWSKPPVVDTRTGRRANPGEDFQCRCWAEMVMEDVLG